MLAAGIDSHIIPRNTCIPVLVIKIMRQRFKGIPLVAKAEQVHVMNICSIVCMQSGHIQRQLYSVF